MDDWNVESIHNLMHDIETTEDAVMDRSALLNLFGYIRQLEQENQLLYGRLNMIHDLTNKEIK